MNIGLSLVRLDGSRGRSAIAADMPITKAPPHVVYDWSGFYVEVGIGVRADLIDASINSASIGTPATPLNTPAQCAAALGVGQSCPNGAALDRGQFRGTIYAGYNWQVTQQWVIGIEADAGTARRTRSVVGGPYPGFIAGIGPAGFGLTGANCSRCRRAGTRASAAASAGRPTNGSCST